VIIINNVVRSSAIYISEFNKENDKKEKKLIGDPKAVCQGK
jgi:hypothetical protein